MVTHVEPTVLSDAVPVLERSSVRIPILKRLIADCDRLAAELDASIKSFSPAGSQNPHVHFYRKPPEKAEENEHFYVGIVGGCVVVVRWLLLDQKQRRGSVEFFLPVFVIAGFIDFADARKSFQSFSTCSGV